MTSSQALTLLLAALVFHETNSREAQRSGRIFSLFNVVKFKNSPCLAVATPPMTGICYSKGECNENQGMAAGSCAAGFGVCCVITRSECNSVINRNCSYVKSPGYPSPDTTTGNCYFNFDKIAPEIRQIRLDFIDTVLSVGLDGADAGNCGNGFDIVTVGSPFAASSSAFPPAVCGILTGQHMYFETGQTGSPAGRLLIGRNTVGFQRQYLIKITFIEENNLLRAPDGCTQYFTGLSGEIQSYNFAGNQLLENQLYSNCIRQERGFCAYSVAQTSADSFGLSKSDSAMVTCKTNSFLYIPRQSAVYSKLMSGNEGFNEDTSCGSTLGNSNGPMVASTVVSERISPFIVGVRSVKNSNTLDADAELMGDIGFSIRYNQIQC